MGDTKHYDAYLEKKLVQLAERFVYHFQEKEYSQAFRIYENVRDIALFMEVPETLLTNLLGNRQDEDESKHVVGIIPEEMVQKAVLECRIKHDTELEEKEARKRMWDDDRRKGKYTTRQTK